MHNEVYIGCSSYQNSYWREIFYPSELRQAKWFEFYCSYFATYEINGTFYKFPTLKSLENWYNRAPEEFIFSVKAPKIITHQKKLANCETEISEFYKVCSKGLKHKLGCILFPPGFDYSKEKLHLIIASLNPEFRNVIEFRHESWFNEEVWESFLYHDITFCSVSYPGLPETIYTEFPMLYIRLHGNQNLFYSGYSDAALRQIIGKTEHAKGFVYFNNTAGTFGILNALQMQKMQSGK
jgi:uncharacterized protein YecE (DUF72 family)